MPTSASQVVRDQRLERGVGIRALFLESALDEIRPATGPNRNVRHANHTFNPLTKQHCSRPATEYRASSTRWPVRRHPPPIADAVMTPPRYAARAWRRHDSLVYVVPRSRAPPRAPPHENDT
jgi:hypothetical protein